MTRHGLILMLSLLPALTPWAQVGENRTPTADWIGAADAPGHGFFRRTVTVEPGVVQAVVTVASAGQMRIYINGRELDRHRGHEKSASFNATALIRPGTNLVAFSIVNEEGPPAGRFVLELATGTGQQRWLISDTSWLAASRGANSWQSAGFKATQPDWKPALSFGEEGFRRWGNNFGATKTIDAYNSWMLARGGKTATSPTQLTAPEGFKVELLRTARPIEGSWVALAFAPDGSLTVSRESKGLVQFTFKEGRIQSASVIEDSLRECRGLLYAHGALYANANNSKALYRLRDLDDDGVYENKEQLLATTGGVGHGRNQMKLGPDGWIYIAHGDDVELPDAMMATAPGRRATRDHLVTGGKPNRRYPKVGQVIRMNAEGSAFEVVANGLRNPLDIAFNPAGELFTYDADNERDIATPWYRPTRVLHVVRGGEYGWRRNWGAWRTDYPDTLPPAVDIGVGSPTGIEFGTASHFPSRWRKSLYIADWAYGRIVAVHLEANGATYTGSFEPFVFGRPLNVTDLTFGPDGAMYFVTGGRGTLSGLYRVSHREPETGPHDRETPRPREVSLRHDLEALHRPASPRDLEFIWKHLAHTDHWVRFAARVALEQQPLDRWAARALEETNEDFALAALLALVRCGDREQAVQIVRRLETFTLATSSRQLAALRIYMLTFTRHETGEALRQAVRRRLEAAYPSSHKRVNEESSRLLAYLGSPAVTGPGTASLANATTTGNLLYHLIQLQHFTATMTEPQRLTFFDALSRAEHLEGGGQYRRALNSVRRDATATLPLNARAKLGALLTAVRPEFVYQSGTAPTVRKWALSDIDALGRIPASTAAAEGRKAFLKAQCHQCHRAGLEPGGTIGPDLTAVAARFGRPDLLRHIIDPSAFIDTKYRQTVLTLDDGTEITGRVESEKEQSIEISVSPVETEQVNKARIKERKPSATSPMPAGLLDPLTREEIQALVVFLEGAGGKPGIPTSR